MLLIVIDTVLAVICGIYMSYLACLSIIALFGKTKGSFPAKNLRRFAVVVPAHNEESSIERTVRSLLAIEYSREKYDVIVIADNCTDRTAELAKDLGAIVYERRDPTLRGKGYALRWCFDRILTIGYDAIVIIDADSVADPGFLSVMNYYLEHGSRAVQCSDLVAPLAGSWSSEITRFGFTLYNYARPLARKVLGCTAGVRGNGMCFTSSTLRNIPWNTYSLNEDLEYGLILLLNGVNVDFAPEAKVLATMPATAQNAETQRSRWERGRFPVIKLYAVKLLIKGIQTFSIRYIDAFLELMTPPFVNLFGAVSLMFILHLAILVAGFSSSVIFPALWGSFIVLGLLHVFAGLYAADADAALYKVFFHIPRYALWKIKLYLISLRRPSTEEWIRTTRDQAVAPKSPDNR